ncbi:hypothetical protein APY04_1882 [Hyphomicrobium sulfonivorans]|uniref:Uncharacterized protein n=1 Tax=Hyphomicrobium sulfonivorans TaxID=121290 RepID=A0A109BEV5_HYPSL|nr:hypothetical protein [Hyphomicrobium sulfonivorans]KWT67523.1 hypothetical protein APY04_1882 [Hyphomicrobium sulfonivorans]
MTVTSYSTVFPKDTPERKRARAILAVFNSTMALFIGAMTVGWPVGLAVAVVLAVLPYAPLLLRVVPELVAENKLSSALAAFLAGAVVGTVIWGFSVAFYIALALVPVMLATILYAAVSNPQISSVD